MALGTKPEDVVLDGDRLAIGDRSVPLVATKVDDVSDSRRTHDQLSMLINYQAPVLVDGQSPYTMYEARHLLAAEDQLQRGEAPDLDPMVFKDKIVFIGLTASGLVDVFQTPFGKQPMPGIQLHASMADSVLSNRFIRPALRADRDDRRRRRPRRWRCWRRSLPFAAAVAGTLVALGGWTGVRAAARSSADCGCRWRRRCWRWRSRSSAAPRTATSSRIAKSGKSRGCSADTSRRDVYAQLLENPGAGPAGRPPP